MRKALAIGVLLLLFSFFAYNAYTYHLLSSAEGAYKLAGIPNSEKLIAVYHDEDFWQFATYDEKTNTLKLYTISQSSPFWPKERREESAKALVNYSPLNLDLKLLKQYEPHEKALLFKTLGWKYDSQINGSYWANLSEVIQPGEEYYRIYGLGSSSGIWIKSKAVCRKNNLDTVCYGYVGVNGLLVLPAYDSSRLLWVKEKPGANNTIERLAYYPRITLKGRGGNPEWSSFAYKQADGRIVCEVLRKIEKRPGIVQIMVTSEGYAFGKYFGSQYCQVKAFWDKNSTEIHDLGCMSGSMLKLVDRG